MLLSYHSKRVQYYTLKNLKLLKYTLRRPHRKGDPTEKESSSERPCIVESVSIAYVSDTDGGKGRSLCGAIND